MLRFVIYSNMKSITMCQHSRHDIGFVEYLYASDQSISESSTLRMPTSGFRMRKNTRNMCSSFERVLGSHTCKIRRLGSSTRRVLWSIVSATRREIRIVQRFARRDVSYLSSYLIFEKFIRQQCCQNSPKCWYFYSKTNNYV